MKTMTKKTKAKPRTMYEQINRNLSCLAEVLGQYATLLKNHSNKSTKSQPAA